jgi:hypothetical protein
LFGKYKSRMKAFSHSYIALHLVLARRKRKGILYLLQAIKIYPSILFTRRCLAIIKRLM